MAFIYKITNTVNGKLYIGKSSCLSLKKLIGRYKKEIKYNNPRLIIRAMVKYGISSFSFEIIKSDIRQDEINNAEMEYITLYNTTDKNTGYNLTQGGEGTVGLKWKKESREKLSNTRKAGNYSGENNPFWGKHHVDATIDKIIESNKRRKGRKLVPMSQATKDKISEKTKGRTSWNKGKEYLQIKGDKNPNYKPINMDLFISLVSDSVHYTKICDIFNISYSHYYRTLKKILNEKISINTEDS
jgi:group I intron endonuclease